MESFTEEIKFIEKLKAALGVNNLLGIEIPRSRRIFLLIDSSGLLDIVTYLKERYGSIHLSTITGLDNGNQLEILYHFNCSNIELTLKTTVSYDIPVLPSLTHLIPGAHFYEREVHDLLGVQFEGHPNLMPIMLPDGWPPDVYPLRKNFSINELKTVASKSIKDSETLMDEGDSTFILPFGPQHPALKEPENFSFVIEGDRIVDVKVRVGYIHRGIEKALENQTYIQNQTLIERVCGICSVVHSQCYVQAVEELLEDEAPLRAQYIRVIACELNRIQSHLLWLGIAAYEIGFNTLFMLVWRDREIALRLLEQITGNRIIYSLTIIGGVRRDLTSELESQILRDIDILRKKAKHYKKLLQSERTVLKRIVGIGVLDKNEAQELCAVGPVLRACGVKSDVRVDDPYAAYTEIPINIITYDGCDIASMVWVRCDEILESTNIITYALEHLPKGEIRKRFKRRVPQGECVSRVEAPRGELIHYLKANGSDRPERYKLRCPTLANLSVVIPMLKGGHVADIPITLAAIDPCFSCNDRMVFLNEKGEKRIWTTQDIRKYASTR